MEIDEQVLSIYELDEAIQNNCLEDVKAYLEAVSLASANDALMAYGQHFNFLTAIVDAPPMDGQAVMLGKDLAKLSYGTPNTAGLKQILSRHGLDLLTIRSITHDVKQFLAERFNLHKKDGRTTFATYKHFLLVAMHGETQAARQIKAHILKAEEAGRIRRATQENMGMSPEQLVDAAILQKHPYWQAIVQNSQTTIQTAIRMAKMEERVNGIDAKATHADERAGQALDMATQARNKVDDMGEKVEGASQAAANALQEVERLRNGQRQTLPDYARQQGYTRRFGSKWIRECATHLVGVHHLQGINVTRIGVAAEPFENLNQYVVEIMAKAVPTWLMQRYGTGLL